MISKSLSTSQRFARLFQELPELAEFAQSLYPLLVAHSDDFGRQAGDLFTVKHKVHPTSPRTDDEFARALQAMHGVALIRWYEAAGTACIQVEKFEKHQTGLHKRTRSEFPAPPKLSGNFLETPTQSPGISRPTEQKRTEGKGTEPNRKDPDQNPRADARLAETTAKDIRRHLAAACHSYLEKHPDAKNGDIADYLKTLAARVFGVRDYAFAIQPVIDAVEGERRRRLA